MVSPPSRGASSSLSLRRAASALATNGSAAPTRMMMMPRTMSGTAHGVVALFGNVMEIDDGAGLVPSLATSSDHSPPAGGFHV